MGSWLVLHLFADSRMSKFLRWWKFTSLPTIWFNSLTKRIVKSFKIKPNEQVNIWLLQITEIKENGKRNTIQTGDMSYSHWALNLALFSGQGKKGWVIYHDTVLTLSKKKCARQNFSPLAFIPRRNFLRKPLYKRHWVCLQLCVAEDRDFFIWMSSTLRCKRWEFFLPCAEGTVLNLTWVMAFLLGAEIIWLRYIVSWWFTSIKEAPRTWRNERPV